MTKNKFEQKSKSTNPVRPGARLRDWSESESNHFVPTPENSYAAHRPNHVEPTEAIGLLPGEVAVLIRYWYDILYYRDVEYSGRSPEEAEKLYHGYCYGVLTAEWRLDRLCELVGTERMREITGGHCRRRAREADEREALRRELPEIYHRFPGLSPVDADCIAYAVVHRHRDAEDPVLAAVTEHVKIYLQYVPDEQKANTATDMIERWRRLQWIGPLGRVSPTPTPPREWW
jgi:hypothetical protein